MKWFNDYVMMYDLLLAGGIYNKMATVNINNDKFQHWLSASVALSIVADGVTDYVIDTTKRLHKTIYTKLASYPNCCFNCSKRYQSLNQWCATCQKWKEEIVFYQRNKYQNVRWQDIDSADWPGSDKEMVKVFCPKIFDGAINLKSDISAMMNLLDNCTQFLLPRHHVRDVRNVRNRYCAHNNTLRLSERDMNDCFGVSEKLLVERVISSTKSGQEALKSLRLLRNTGVKKFLDINDKNTTKEQAIQCNRQSLLELQNKVLERMPVRRQRVSNVQQNIVTTSKRVTPVVLVLFCLIFVFIGFPDYRSSICIDGNLFFIICIY